MRKLELLRCEAADLLPFASEFDVCIFDPPYSADVHSKATSAGTGGFSPTGKGVRKRDFGFEHLTSDGMRLFAEFAAKCRRWSIIYTDVESVGTWKQALIEARAEYVRPVVWERWSQPQLSGDRPPQGWECCVLAHSAHVGARGGVKSKAKHWNGYGELTGLHHEPLVLKHKTLRGDEKFKAEKPLDQMLDLVSWLSDPGELVADVVAGRGTTARACQILGRAFVGCERDPKTHARAIERLDSAPSKGEIERVQRYIASVSEERRPPEQFEPAVARYWARHRDMKRAAKWLAENAR